MRVLGIDPGLTRCGFGVVEGLPGRPPTLHAVGVIQTDPQLDTPRRLVTIEAEIEKLVLSWLPDVVAIERVFAQHNVNTVMGTAQAAGVAMLVGARRELPVALHTPSEVKAAITGSGRADKAQIGAMVARILKLQAPPKPADAADAVALAICHVWRGGVSNKLTEATARQRAGQQSDRGRGEQRLAEAVQLQRQRDAARRSATGTRTPDEASKSSGRQPNRTPRRTA